MEIPSNMLYTKSHEWASIEGDIATIGITDYAQNQLSDIVYIEYLVEPGDKVQQDKAFATLESVKAASDVNSAVNGVVLEVNEVLADTPELVNTKPYGAWMAKVQFEDPKDLAKLMDAKAYQIFCEEQAH